MTHSTAAPAPKDGADNTPLFKRLRKLLSGNGADTPAQLEAAIAGVAQAHAAAAAAARATRAAHEAAVLGLLVNEDEEALAASRREAAAAAAHEAELATALEGLKQRLTQLRAASAAAASRALWRECQARLAARGKAMAELQARADAYAQSLEHAAQTSEAVWAALPALPSHRPATYGRDLYTRAALYLYGATQGKSGGSATSPTSAHVARQRPDLVALDAGARDILLMPLTQGDQQGNQGEAA